MSEQQPLLHNDEDVEAGDNSAPRSARYRKRMRETLESEILHWTVIALITIDGCCVLADLGYTLLSPACEPPESGGPVWLEVLSTISMVIVSIFLVEIPLAIFAFGFRYYNPFGNYQHAILHFFDATIIVATFVLEIALRGKERELAELLILLRLWRLVKLVGGIAVGAGELEEGTLNELNELKTKYSELSQSYSKLEDENKQLRLRVGTSANEDP